MGSGFELTSFTAAYVSRFVLAAVRVLAAISMNPLLGSGRIPLPARIGFGLFTTLVVLPPGASDRQPVAVGPAEIAGELLVGLLAGFAVVLVFAVVSMAGSLIGMSAGFNFGSTLDPSFDLGTGGLERFFSTFALIIFVQIDGHHLFLAGLHQLFQTIDVGSVSLAPGTAERLAVMSGAVFSAGLQMALPAVAALALADLGLVLLARVAPQFNLFVISMPAKMAVGLAALIVALPIMVPRMVALFRGLQLSMLALGSQG